MQFLTLFQLVSALDAFCGLPTSRASTKGYLYVTTPYIHSSDNLFTLIASDEGSQLTANS